MKARVRADVLPVFFTLVAVVFTAVYPLILGVNNPNENARTYMTMALVEEHTLRVDAIRDRYGWTNDMARVPGPGPDEEHYYSVKAPAVSYSGVPVYWLFSKIAPLFGHPLPNVDSPQGDKDWWLRASTFTLRLFCVQLPCLAFLIWFERWLRGVTRDQVLRLSAVAAVGLGTNFLTYALMFASHALFAVAAFLSFAITTREWQLRRDPKKRRPSRAFWAGFCAGWATLLEYHALPVSIILAGYAIAIFWRVRKNLGAVIGGGAIHVLLLMLFQWRAYGSPFTPGHRMVEASNLNVLHNRGVFGVTPPRLHELFELTFSPGFGFFTTSSFMWLGLLAIPWLYFARRKMRIATGVWLGAMAVLFVTVSGVQVWRAGWTIGPRYFGCAPPFFAFGALCALEYAARRFRYGRLVARGLAGGLAIASVVQTGFISVEYNTLPETVTRPLTEAAIPLLRGGFVPYHAGHLFGAGYSFFYFVVGCLIAAPLVVALAREGDRWRDYGLRAAIVIASATLGVLPSTSSPPKGERDAGERSVHWLATVWEPPERDRLRVLRRAAERSRDPCAYAHLAAVERALRYDTEAALDERRAKAVRADCPKGWAQF